MSTGQPVVLDTNTVMALWWFEDPRLAPLAEVLDRRRLNPLCRNDALGELAAVLAYRQFDIAPARQQEILARYRRRCLLLSSPCDGAALPRCKDRDDQKFLEIAHDGGATLLVTRDKALLKLNRHRLIRPLYRILTPERLSDELAPARGPSQA